MGVSIKDMKMPKACRRCEELAYDLDQGLWICLSIKGFREHCPFAPVRPAVWISVKDRLPDNTDHVLCCTVNKAGRQNVVRGYYDAECNGGMWACGTNSNVTHWMPLPDPPELEKED